MEVDVKEEPEESKPFVSTMDVKKEGTSTWLVRVPQWLAEFWSTQDQDVDLGKVRIKTDPNNVKNNEAYLFLPEKFDGLPCNQFKMKPATISKPIKILSEDVTGNVTVEGSVKHKFDLEPLEKSKLRNSIVNYAAQHDSRNKNNVLSKTKVLDPKPISGKLFKNDLTGGKRKRDEKGVPEKRERTDKDKLMELIFECFREKEYWNLKELNERCQQPVTWLKEVLAQYCDYNKKGPNKQMYELRSEYAPNKKPKTEERDDDNE